MCFNVKMPDGLVCEMQVQTAPMLVAKQEAHPLYEEERELAEKKSLSTDERARLAELRKTQRALYAAAHRAALAPA